MRVARLKLADGRRAYVSLENGEGALLSDAPWQGGRPTGERVGGLDGQGRGAAVSLLPPVQPSKIVCVGRNYRAHAAELGNELPAEPLLFLKPPSSLLGPDGTIELPPPELSRRVEHEVELGVVMGQRLRKGDPAEAEAAIWGYTVVADITARDLQRRDGQWTRAKGFDPFCPVGPVVVSELDPSALAIECDVSDKPRQRGNTSAMVARPAELLAFISQCMTLEPGDLVATGTPAGVGPLTAGDALVMRVESIGALHLAVAG